MASSVATGASAWLSARAYAKARTAVRALVSVVALQTTLCWAVEVGEAAPEIVATTSGTAVTLTSLRGQWVYLDFWASWCGPCKQSFPWMNEMHAKYGSRGLRIIAVNVDAKASDAERFLSGTPAKFAVAYDPKGETPKRYAVKAMPTSYLIDPKGRVTLVHAGFRENDRAALEGTFVNALNNKGTP